jgi:hypothetical protein
MPILRQVYGADAPMWRRRWRMFFLATAECSATPMAACGA